MRETQEGSPEKVIRVELDPEEKKLLVEKMEALQAYRAAEARLTMANLKLLERDIRPNLGDVMCW